MISDAKEAERVAPHLPLNQVEALDLLRRACSLQDPTLLGAGKEGFVFASEGHAYKVFAEGRSAFYDGQLSFLKETLIKPDAGTSRILPLLDIIETGDDVIFVAPQVSGTPYAGGHWYELVQLIQECRERGIGLTNLSPSNFLVTPTGVVYADLGRSVERLTDSRLSQMCKRAFLNFKFPNRPSLVELLHRSLSEPGMPELDGIEVFEMDAGVRQSTRETQPSVQPFRPARDVTLLIRTCAMEWRTIDFQIRHIVAQLEGPHRFRERLVVWDTSEGPFTRQYDVANVEALRRVLDRLLTEGVVDRLVAVPQDLSTVKATALRWFGRDTTSPKSERGAPTHACLYGFDQCGTNLVLQVDSDILIGRLQPGHDYLSPMIDVMERDPNAVAVSLPPPLAAEQEFSRGGAASKWRVDPRCSLINRERLERLLPLPNRLTESGQLELSWHRALDARLAHTDGQCYRGGTPATWYIHVPNSRKETRNEWFNIACAVQRGQIFPEQIGHVDLLGSQEDWLGKRGEHLVFLVRGRDVPLPKLRRCIGSLLIQEDQDFGVIFVDAGSSNGMAEYLEVVCRRELNGRSTLYRNWDTVTSIENQARCIRSLVARPESTVAVLDADDALLGRHAVERIKRAYAEGADLTVGSVLRTDRHVDYGVSFEDPRHNRRANIWQHIKTFRRALFDRIRDEDLKVDGTWIPYAEDWAIMVPMVEIASHPVWIQDRLYLYDPDLSRRPFSRDEGERMIAKICQKPSRAPVPRASRSTAQPTEDGLAR